MEACRNMVPVSKVVYNILTKMEEPFNLSFLEMLFSQINLREYPNLVAIQRSFRNGMMLLKYLWGYRSMRGVAMLKVWVVFQPQTGMWAHVKEAF